jgi:hypothetical protein
MQDINANPFTNPDPAVFEQARQNHFRLEQEEQDAFIEPTTAHPLIKSTNWSLRDFMTKHGPHVNFFQLVRMSIEPYGNAQPTQSEIYFAGFTTLSLHDVRVIFESKFHHVKFFAENVNRDDAWSACHDVGQGDIHVVDPMVPLDKWSLYQRRWVDANGNKGYPVLVEEDSPYKHNGFRLTASGEEILSCKPWLCMKDRVTCTRALYNRAHADMHVVCLK